MREHPIIFSTEMIRAYLDGRKTQTRRVIKFRPEPNHIEEFTQTWLARCPYGQVGDVLWCKETWATHKVYDDLKPSDIPEGSVVYYKASEITLRDASYVVGKWRTPRFMPRWASRITQTIIGLSVERLQEITEEDAKAEGVNPKYVGGITTLKQQEYYQYKLAYIDLWDALNTKRGFSWERNPYVYVITFPQYSEEVPRRLAHTV